MRTPRGERVPVRLSPELAAAVKVLARREGVTPFMVLLAAWQTLLSRYSGQDDISVGTAITGRGRAELQGLIGFFVNTLVLRTRLAGNPTFRELLGRVRESALGAYAHQDVPFEKLVEALQPSHSRGHSPIFQVMFLLQDGTVGTPVLSGVEARPLDVHTGTSMFDLTLSLSESGRGLEGWLEYATDLFDVATVERMGAHLRVLLEGALARPERRLSELPLLEETERHQLLVEWSGVRVEAEVEAGAVLHQAFEAQVERTPEAVALIAGTQRLTYRELEARANRLAWRLRALGVGPETLVGVYLERTAELVVALLGTLKAGGAYVPLDPAYPRERLEYTLRDARARVLLTREGLREALGGHEARVVCVDTDARTLEAWSAQRPEREAGAAHLAYVLYTSGSTGRPKGVALEHRGAVAFLRWAAASFTPRQLERVLAATSICFDLSVFELFAPLSSGGAVVLAENALALPMLEAASEVTLINTVPSAMAALVHMGGVPASVRTVNLAGEPLPGTLVEALYRETAVEQVFNLYGPTEDTTYSTYALAARGAGREPTIGCPLPGTRAYVLDAWLRPVPRGVSGELYLGGVGQARGYLNRPELTAERFVPDPFSPEPGARLYRTGDRVRFLADGSLEYQGRIDFQVKVRGFRIEPGEIEVVLGQHESVRDAAVLAREDVPGDRRLVAYVVARPGQALDVSALRGFAQRRLPDFMVPAAFVVLEALPLTPNGKVDRKALPAPEAPLAPASHVPPRDELEQRLADIWAQVLRVERVGRQAHF
ncbi:MAG: non-ribosomal peptide synthetase, partial [Archangium sp.]